MSENVIATLRVTEPDKFTPERRAQIADWLMDQAEDILDLKKEFSKTYTARFIRLNGSKEKKNECS